MDKEFCLLNEPWIKVLDQENTIKEVSLLDVFRDAHKYKSLAGETVTQDASILRLLLAIVITVFYRYDVDGQEDNVLEYEDPEEVILERWSEYWKKGAFKADTFQKYLETYKERFFLFHPETPFWQVADLKDGTNYGIINLYGNIKESNNVASRHHFHMTDGHYVETVSYAETARWLVYNNAYSINVKTKVDGKNKPTGVGRLGKLGLIIVEENTIYKTILMNLCALNGQGMAWNEPKPIWEQPPKIEVGVEIVPPDNLPELYTIQSRRSLLQRKDGWVSGYRSVGGDYYSIINDLVEPMTLLKQDSKDKENIKPLKHQKSIAAWREFPSMLVQSESLPLKPGLIRWLEELMEDVQMKNKQLITFHMIGLEYGDGMSYTNGELIDESLSMSKELIKEKGDIWRRLITDEIEKCEEVVQKSYYFLAKELAADLYKGDKKKTTDIVDSLATAYYYKIDRFFREWLISIKPGESKKEEKEYEWQQTSSKIAESVVVDYISGIDPQHIMICAKAVGIFKKNLYKIYPGMEKKGGDENEQEK